MLPVALHGKKQKLFQNGLRRGLQDRPLGPAEHVIPRFHVMELKEGRSKTQKVGRERLFFPGEETLL